VILYRCKEEMRMDKNKKAILAQRVKERMRMLGMNALQLSESSGVSQSIISRLTNEKAFPSAGNLEKIAMSLDTTGSYLLGDSETCERRSLDEIKNKVRGQLEELTVEEKAELAWFILTPANKKIKKT
jgi:transcriptional regulator with XRE-family HTH domain